MATEAKFSTGQIVQHLRFDYRGVIFDVDATFSGSDEWYEQVARSRPPKEQPWYHVLVDGGVHTTYVAERHLEPAEDDGPVRHPGIEAYFAGYADGAYRPKHSLN